jgi:hypothetical protein
MHLFGLNKTTIETATPLRSSLGALPDAALTQLELANAALDTHLNRPLGSLITPELKQLDVKRDGKIEEIKRDVKAAAKSSDTVKSNAGKILLHFLTPYWNTEKQALNTETGLIGEIIDRFNSDLLLVNSASVIGISLLWSELSNINTLFSTLYRERNAELAAKEVAASALRNDAVKSYENFCTLVEQAANLTPSDNLNTLFKQLDNLRKTYQGLTPKKKEEEKEI